MVQIVIGINGMACGICGAHIHKTMGNAFRIKKGTSSHAGKQTVIFAEQEIPE